MMKWHPTSTTRFCFRDGDFRQLLEAVQRRGVRVTVISTFRAQSPMVSDELRVRPTRSSNCKTSPRTSPAGAGVTKRKAIFRVLKKPAARNPTPADPEPGFDEDDGIYEDA